MIKVTYLSEAMSDQECDSHPLNRGEYAIVIDGGKERLLCNSCYQQWRMRMAEHLPQHGMCEVCSEWDILQKMSYGGETKVACPKCIHKYNQIEALDQEDAM